MKLTNFNTKIYTMVFKLPKEDKCEYVGLYVECKPDELSEFLEYAKQTMHTLVGEQPNEIYSIVEGDFVCDSLDDNTVVLIENTEKKTITYRENYYISIIRQMRQVTDEEEVKVDNQSSERVFETEDVSAEELVDENSDELIVEPIED